MKKSFSRLTALLLAVAIGVSMCLVASAYTFSMSYTSGFTVTSGVTYAKYSVSSMNNNVTQPCTTMTFNPSNGYIPMVFSCYAGTSGTLATQYSQAVNKYGYSVAGAVNGSFFSMGTPYGTLVGINISNGKVSSAHLGYSDSVVAFGSDGSINVCQSALKYTITINGNTYADMIYYINKTSGTGSWSDRFYYYDTSCGSKADTSSSCPGTEILCRKLDNTDLSVGQTLVGEVLSITSNTYGGSIASDNSSESDNFILFMKAGSSYESYISGLTVGSTVKIRTEETVEESKEIMENANSVITNVGWLVKNGVDRTQIDSTIGTHSVTLQARWTAFGTKADGSYVFFTSEGGSTGSSGSLTLQDVAAAMMEMGCTNVIRMDGGGSSAMYLSNTGSGSAGYVQSSTRSIGDCILVVNRSSVQKTGLKDTLLAQINTSENDNQLIGLAELTAAINDARTVYNSTTSVSGDYKREIMKLMSLTSGSGLLDLMITNAMNISENDYCDRALDLIDCYCLEGKRLRNLTTSTDAELRAAALQLSNAMADTTTGYDRISLGVAYDAQAANVSYPDTGKREMTDGAIFGTGGTSTQWTGYHYNSKSGTDSDGNYCDIQLDLGSVKTVNGFGLTTLNLTAWGINAPTLAKVYASADGTQYYLHSTLERKVTPVSGVYQVINFDAISEPVTARYIVFRVYYTSNHLFIGETSVYGPGGSSATDLTAFNSMIYTDYAVIYTSAFGALTSSNANLTWSHGFICSYDSTTGGYTIGSIVYPAGDTTYSYTVPTDGIIIGLHGAAYGSNASSAQVGDTVFLSGIDVSALAKRPGARITFKTRSALTVTYAAPAVAAVSSSSGITVDGSLCGLASEGTTSAALAAAFLDPRAVISSAVAGTGTTVTVAATGETYTMYLSGDLSGDGYVTAIDYLMLKRTYLGTYTASSAQTKAGCIEGGTAITAYDYLKLKRHVLGSFNIFA